jgi:hypothetical protein
MTDLSKQEFVAMQHFCLLWHQIICDSLTKEKRL